MVSSDGALHRELLRWSAAQQAKAENSRNGSDDDIHAASLLLGLNKHPSKSVDYGATGPALREALQQTLQELSAEIHS